MTRRELQIDSYLFEIANHNFVQTFLNNNLLKNHLSVCHKLELSKINKVYLLETHIKNSKPPVVENNKSLLSSRFLTPPPIERDYEKYFFQVETKPNNGLYEFTVTNEFDLKRFRNSFKIDQNSVSRINMYGNSSHCIFNDFPDLRKYCYCK
jgi:hypothetical protein